MGKKTTSKRLEFILLLWSFFLSLQSKPSDSVVLSFCIIDILYLVVAVIETLKAPPSCQHLLRGYFPWVRNPDLNSSYSSGYDTDGPRVPVSRPELGVDRQAGGSGHADIFIDSRVGRPTQIILSAGILSKSSLLITFSNIGKYGEDEY